ncbi:MAG: TonB-dependent receptor, partial [Sediminibacterium sp.]|nr:TonB-dependent receptor [Sediminibacterium sp.]
LTCVLIPCLFFYFAVPAQEKLFQTVKGTVIDGSLKSPLHGATIYFSNGTAKEKIASSDSTGFFVLGAIPVGRQSIRVSYVGYKPITLTNLLVESGKELILTIEMEEVVATTKEVIVQSRSNKSRPLNELALVSSRMFSVEETRRYAAGLNDPARIATAFAGVSGNGDRNALIIRGNAPNGLLWRMEGVDIPNPNHFARVGTSGGGISILSAQLLANSDFMTAAFPAEYGNALSGVFDIHLRKGNKDKREHTFSVSTIGVDLATEGYFKKGSNSSYLVNYRYGFLTLMQQLGFKISDAATSFQDLSFNIHLATKKAGEFSFFGFGGLSQQKKSASNDSITWFSDPSKRSGRLDASNTGMLAIKHSIMLGKKTLLNTIYSINATDYKDEDSRFDKFNTPLTITRNNQFTENNAVFSIVVTHKINKHHLVKIGAYTTGNGFDLKQREAVSNVLRDKIKADGNTRLTHAFAQWKWDPSAALRIQMGIHSQYFSLNKTSTVEPRVGLRYMTGKNQFLSLGYGLHAQVQPLGDYFVRIKIGADSVQPNKTMDFSKSHHFVVGYSIQFAKNWNVKAEVYYQSLYSIPVSATKSNSYSIINQDDDYAIEALSNKGKGKNYGIEFTLERYWNDQFYFLGTLSLYQSKYLPSDNTWRNTCFNSNESWTFLLGKEWNLHSRRPSTISLDLKMIHNGGVRVTPINLAQSIVQKTTVLDNNRIFEDKLPPLFRIDLQTEWRIQYRKMTGSLIFGVQNLTNRQNPVNQSYDASLGRIKYTNLLGLIPVVGYKVDL